MGKTSRSDTSEPRDPPPERGWDTGHPNPLDVVVLLSIAVFMVVSPPDLQYLEYRYAPGSPLSGETLRGASVGLSTLLLVTYFLAAIGGRGRWAARLKLGIVLALGVICVLLPTASDMLARHEVGLHVNGRTVSFAHDGGVLQTEAAIGFLLRGQSPYSADYSGSVMALGTDSRQGLWQSLGFEGNPAYHFYPYPPFTVLLSLPFCLVSHATLGWFDQRMVYFVAWAVLAVLGHRLPASPHWRLPLMVLLVLNPISAMFFVLGTNDILCVTFLVATVFLLARKRCRGSSLLLGLSCGVKQFAWILVPFYLAYLYTRLSDEHDESKRKQLWRLSWPLFVSAGVILLPFLVWDPKGLFDSLIVGQGVVYPFRHNSLGFSNFLILFNVIESYRDQFPLLAFHVFIVLPVGVYGLRRVLKQQTVSSMAAWYAVTLLLLLFFGRNFAHSYLTVVFSMMAVSWALARDEPQQAARMGPPQ